MARAKSPSSTTSTTARPSTSASTSWFADEQVQQQPDAGPLRERRLPARLRRRRGGDREARIRGPGRTDLQDQQGSVGSVPERRQKAGQRRQAQAGRDRI